MPKSDPRGAVHATAEVPPVQLSTDRCVPLEGCIIVEPEYYGRPCGRRDWNAIFVLEYGKPAFLHYRHVSGAKVYRGDQYDGFAKRPWNAVGSDGRSLSSCPRTTYRGTFFMRQHRWWKTPEAAMRAVEAEEVHNG